MARTVLHGTTIIEERTAQGKGFRGAFKGYSSGWKRVRAALGLETAKVNLEFGYERKKGTPVSGGERVMAQEQDRWQKRPSMLAALQGKVVNRSTGEIFFSHGTIDYELICFVKHKNIDTARNQIAEAIDEKLDTDRTRGGYAIDTQVISVEVDDGTIDPIGGVIVTVQILYSYTRGDA
jgi:hypothetical protein